MRTGDIILIGGAAAVLTAAVLFVDIKTPEEYYALHPTEVTEDGEYVTIKVDSSAVDGGISLEGRYALVSGDSVYDVAARVLRYEGIDLDTKGGRAVYISGIGGLEEFDYGAESGCSGYTGDDNVPQVTLRGRCRDSDGAYVHGAV